MTVMLRKKIYHLAHALLAVACFSLFLNSPVTAHIYNHANRPLVAGQMRDDANAVLDSFSKKASPGHSPLLFIENAGQVTDQFRSQRTDIQFSLPVGGGLTIFIGNGAIHYQYSGGMPDLSSGHSMYRMDVELTGANKKARIIASTCQRFSEHYFTTGAGEKGIIAHSYKRITYKDIYPHIDWVLSVNGQQLKHEFVIRQGGKASDIKFKYCGATDLKLNQGKLYATTPQGAIIEDAPYSYQNDGKKIRSSFKLDGNVLSYKIDNYRGVLTIDPTLEWTTYFGGNTIVNGYAVAVDAAENVYVSGTTSCTSGIATIGAYQATFAGGFLCDAFLVKFNSAGQRIWATYYGGDGQENGYSLATDNSGNVYMAGATTSNFGMATTGAFQEIFTGVSDPFLAKFDSLGFRQWATYYGASYFGSQFYDLQASVATDGSGNVYLAGNTSSTAGIATPGAFKDTIDGVMDAFLVKFNSGGTRLWGTYYGGSAPDAALTVTTDQLGNVFIAGLTFSQSGIATPGACQEVIGDTAVYADAFLAKFDSSGTRQWGTYYGGSSDDGATAIATDQAGNIYLAGYTTSQSGIATPGAFRDTINNYGSIYDGFLVRFNSSGVRHWGTYYGGDNDDYCASVATDGSGNAYITGPTSSPSGIASPGAYQDAIGDSINAFLAKFDSSGNRLWGTYYGASGAHGASVCTNSIGDVYLTGETGTPGIATVGIYQDTLSGYADAFLAKFSGEGTGVKTIKNDNKLIAALYPNPTSGAFSIDVSETGMLVIYSIDGRIIGSCPISKGTTKIELPAGLTQGLYACYYKGNDGKVDMMKLVYEP